MQGSAPPSTAPAPQPPALPTQAPAPGASSNGGQSSSTPSPHPGGNPVPAPSGTQHHQQHQQPSKPGPAPSPLAMPPVTAPAPTANNGQPMPTHYQHSQAPPISQPPGSHPQHRQTPMQQQQQQQQQEQQSSSYPAYLVPPQSNSYSQPYNPNPPIQPNFRHRMRRRLDPGHHDSQRKGPDEPRPYTAGQLDKMMNMLMEIAQKYQDDARLHQIMMGYYDKVKKAKEELGPVAGSQ
mmetsp:Transcript_5404/g.11479  ORF Transcript_5404/g.11479 Transcript_5404/m.11479 type:complete len:236 (-) Transcript_5404:96-803(-)